MPYLIAFVFCIAFLLLAGGIIKIGLALMVLVYVMLAGFTFYLFARLFFDPPGG